MQTVRELINSRRSAIPTVLGAMLLGALSGSAVAEPCPYNWYRVFPEPADSSTAISGPGYDWRGASVGVVAPQVYGGDYWAGSQEVRATDEFILEGPEPGTELSVRALLSVQASIQTITQSWSYGSTLGSLGMIGGPSVELWLHAALGYRPTMNESRPLDITVFAGQPFRLRLEARAGAQEASAWASARLSFPDLPPGVTLRSCQGLEFGGGPVAARRQTWGALKARYR